MAPVSMHLPKSLLHYHLLDTRGRHFRPMQSNVNEFLAAHKVGRRVVVKPARPIVKFADRTPFHLIPTMSWNDENMFEVQVTVAGPSNLCFCSPTYIVDEGASVDGLFPTWLKFWTKMAESRATHASPLGLYDFLKQPYIDAHSIPFWYDAHCNSDVASHMRTIYGETSASKRGQPLTDTAT